MNTLKILITISVLSFLAGTDFAQEAKPAYISGHIASTAGDSIHLTGLLTKSNIGTFRNDIQIPMPVDAQGNFRIFLGRLSMPARFSLSALVNRDMNSPTQDIIIDPGDDAKINIDFSSKKQSPLVYFSGKEAAKWQCQQKLSEQMANIGAIFEKFNAENHIWAKAPISDSQAAVICNKLLTFSDSLFRAQMFILNRYKSRLSLQDYDILKADVFSGIFSVGYVDYMLRMPQFYSFSAAKAYYDASEREFSKYYLKDASEIVCSRSYMKFLIEKGQVGLAIENKGHNNQIGDWYNYLVKTYQGPLREALISYYFLQDISRGRGGEFIPAVSADQYSSCLLKAYQLVQNPLYKTKLAELMRLRKGVPAYNFDLPLDTTNKRLRLTDLKGKVVLIDEWSYICGGCAGFATDFHKKVYPLFKGNPNFAYVSIGRTDNKKEYRQRLLHLDYGQKPDISPDIYTSPDYINLYEAQDKPDGKKMDEYYNVYNAPFLLLIDKDGKIYSSNVPDSEHLDNSQVQRLIDLINGALAEKD